MTDKDKIINLLHQRLQLYRELGGLFSGGVPSTRAVDYYYAECAAIIELVKSLPEENKGIMDYKKKYEQAIEILKKIKAANKDNKELVDFIEYEYPELKESDDERIRKQLLNWFKDCKWNAIDKETLKREDIIAWLEKQGEQKFNDVYPIFRVGDYIKNKKTGDKVLIEQLDIATKAYCYVSYDGAAGNHSDFPFVKQDEWELIGQKVVEQNPAWSEEDENAIQVLRDIVKHSNEINENIYTMPLKEKLYDWLKSLKERMKGDKQ